MEISEKDQLMMHSMYKSNSGFTYDDIARAFERQYPGITKAIVGNIIRGREKNWESYVPIESDRALKDAIQIHKDTLDIQATRKK